MGRPTKCTVNLTKLVNNFLTIKKYVNKKVLALVKADAYGHGLVECAKALQNSGVDYLGTATPEEGVILRNNGITCPILCVGALQLESEMLCVDYSIEQAISSINDFKKIEKYCVEVDKKAYVHIKIETGMHRTGIRLDDLNNLLNEIKKSKYVIVKGAFTHFALSDSDDRSYTDFQANEFKKAVDLIKNSGFDDLIIHCANSGGILQYPELTFDMVRAGIIIYGYYPSPETQKSFFIEPVLTFETKIVAINDVKKGETISYGCTYKAQRDMRVAVLPVGYGDGYKRIMSNRGYVLINGKEAPITGRICMDMTMVDVTDIPDVKIGDDVVLIGEQADKKISADDLAEWAETINYEIMLSITARVPKNYV